MFILSDDYSFERVDSREVEKNDRYNSSIKKKVTGYRFPTRVKKRQKTFLRDRFSSTLPRNTRGIPILCKKNQKSSGYAHTNTTTRRAMCM